MGGGAVVVCVILFHCLYPAVHALLGWVHESCIEKTLPLSLSARCLTMVCCDRAPIIPRIREDNRQGRFYLP